MDYKKLFKLFSYFFLLSSVSIFISIPFVKYSSDSWYVKSPISPPAALFAPMWGTLFLLIYLSISKLVKVKDKLSLPFWLFSIQMLFNFLWGILFNNYRSLIGGAISLLFAHFFIIATVIEFRKKDKTAGYLLLPYLSWVTIAVILSFSNALVN